MLVWEVSNALFFFSEDSMVRNDGLNKKEKAILWIVLIAIALFSFSKLSLDAIILGAIAIYLYQQQSTKKRVRTT